MDLIVGLFIFFFGMHFWFKLEKKWDQKRRDKENERIKTREESYQKYIQDQQNQERADAARERKKEAIRKQKEESDKSILEAKRERKIREKLEAIQKESISRQKNAIEEIDQEVVIKWHKDVISKCQKYESSHSNFLADYEDFKNSQAFLDKLYIYLLLSLNPEPDSKLFELINWGNKLEWEDVSNLELYLVKLKNTIDGKLYLVVGTTESTVEEDFTDDPVAEIVEVVTSINVNKHVALFLEECLLYRFRPDGTFDPFAKFDGYEGVIELRYLKQALKMIDDFEHHQKDVVIILQNFEKMDYKQLEEVFENYHLNDFKNFNDYYVGYIGKKMPITKRDFLNSLCELYERNVLFLNEINDYYENELDEMNQSYTLWLQKQIDVMEAHVYKTLGTYDANANAPWRKGLYFRRHHPLGLDFNAEKPIVLLQWKGKIEYKTMRTDLIF